MHSERGYYREDSIEVRRESRVKRVNNSAQRFAEVLTQKRRKRGRRVEGGDREW